MKISCKIPIDVTTFKTVLCTCYQSLPNDMKKKREKICEFKKNAKIFVCKTHSILSSTISMTLLECGQLPIINSVLVAVFWSFFISARAVSLLKIITDYSKLNYWFWMCFYVGRFFWFWVVLGLCLDKLSAAHKAISSQNQKRPPKILVNRYDKQSNVSSLGGD